MYYLKKYIYLWDRSESCDKYYFKLFFFVEKGKYTDFSPILMQAWQDPASNVQNEKLQVSAVSDSRYLLVVPYEKDLIVSYENKNQDPCQTRHQLGRIMCSSST